MTWKHELAGAAGGTLGYIVGDIPGAASGYEYGKGAAQLVDKWSSKGKFLYLL